MRNVITGLCLATALFAALSVAVLFTTVPTKDDILLAGGLTLLAALFFAIRHVYLIRFGRLGLLKPRVWRKEMSSKTYKSAVLRSTAGDLATLLQHHQATRASGTAPDSVSMLVYTEMRKIAALGYGRETPSQDELISQGKLLRFVQPHRSDRSAPPMEELRGVRDTEVFFELRRKVDDWYARRDARNAAYADWKDAVGGESRDHLLDGGWIPFLTGLDGPDIYLWHGVATDFHEIDVRDRLDAAFWILEQPECDKATASDFILNYVEYRLEDRRIELGELARFAEVVKRYNGGFYRFQSIRPDTGPRAMFGDRPIEEVMAGKRDRALGGLPEGSEARRQLEAAHAGLPPPSRLLEAGAEPKDDRARHVDSGFSFWDDAGLHLTYPGDDWRKSA